MPASPDSRAAAAPSRSTKKLASSSSASSLGSGSTMNKSASESSIKKHQGSLLEQELLLLERDEGKRHARELSACLLEYAKKIEDLQEKNRRLEEEVGYTYTFAVLDAAYIRITNALLFHGTAIVR